MQSISNLDYLDEAEASRLVQLSIAGTPEHVVILHKAECFEPVYEHLRNGRRFARGYSTSSDLNAWLAAYCKGEFRAQSVEMKAKVIDLWTTKETHTGFEGKIYFVGFEDENDAFAFKMRWGGR